jgi:hypothetical protein
LTDVDVDGVGEDLRWIEVKVYLEARYGMIYIYMYMCKCGC